MHGSDLILGFFENLVEKIDRYQRVEKPKAETPIDENEIQINNQGGMRNYITYAMSLLHVFISLCLVQFLFCMVELLNFFFFFFVVNFGAQFMICLLILRLL